MTCSSRAPLAGRRHRRPAQRRQVDAVQPHPRPAGSPSSRSSPASPATARRSRPSGSAGGSGSSTPAAGCPAASDLDEKVTRQSERAMRGRRRRRHGGRRHRRRHRGGRPGRRPPAPRPAAGARWSSTRSTTPGASDDIWDFVSLGLGDPCRGERPPRPPRRRPARRGAGVLPEPHRRPVDGADGGVDRGADPGTRPSIRRATPTPAVRRVTTTPCRWRSSAVRTSASRRCSTG